MHFPRAKDQGQAKKARRQTLFIYLHFDLPVHLQKNLKNACNVMGVEMANFVLYVIIATANRLK